MTWKKPGEESFYRFRGVPGVCRASEGAFDFFFHLERDVMGWDGLVGGGKF